MIPFEGRDRKDSLKMVMCAMDCARALCQGLYDALEPDEPTADDCAFIAMAAAVAVMKTFEDMAELTQEEKIKFRATAMKTYYRAWSYHDSKDVPDE